SVRVRAGETTSLELVLQVATPPVDRIDTLRSGESPSSGAGVLGWVDPGVVRTLPRSHPDLASLLALTGRTDDGLGVEGPPERLPALCVDGYALQPAREPASAGDPTPSLIVPRNGLAAASLPMGSDVEWSGGPGGNVALSTGVERSTPELFARLGGRPTWRG